MVSRLARPLAPTSASNLAPPTSDGTAPRVLVLLPGYHVSRRPDAAADDGPLPDYLPLCAALRADVADYAAVAATRHPLVWLAGWVGMDAQIAAYAFLHRRHYDVMFSYTDSISLPLAALFALIWRRPKHVVTAHSIGSGRRGRLLRWVHPWIDTVVLYSPHVRDVCRERIGVPAAKLRLCTFQADSRYFAPLADTQRRRQICIVGLERRDFATLIEAVSDLDVDVRLTAFSPMSKEGDATKAMALPPNVTVKRYAYSELRRLYAESRCLVLPLFENQYAAGITALYEAMAMGCPAIVSRTSGLEGVIQDGVTAVFVPPGDAQALRGAITTLLADPEKAEQIGRNGRHVIDSHINLDAWVQEMVSVVHAVSSDAGHARVTAQLPVA